MTLPAKHAIKQTEQSKTWSEPAGPPTGPGLPRTSRTAPSACYDVAASDDRQPAGSEPGCARKAGSYWSVHESDMRLICDSETCLFLSAASRKPPQPSAPPAEPSGPNSSESVQYKYTEYSQFYVATARAAESIRVVVNLYSEVFSSGRY